MGCSAQNHGRKNEKREQKRKPRASIKKREGV